MKVEILGGIAGLLCTISFFPQVLKLLRSKNAADISLLTFSVFSIGVFLWFVYGLLINDLPVILTNITIFFLAISIVIMKLKYTKKD